MTPSETTFRTYLTLGLWRDVDRRRHFGTRYSITCGRGCWKSSALRVCILGAHCRWDDNPYGLAANVVQLQAVETWPSSEDASIKHSLLVVTPTTRIVAKTKMDEQVCAFTWQRIATYYIAIRFTYLKSPCHFDSYLPRHPSRSRWR
jgi:hypothetical protein